MENPEILVWLITTACKIIILTATVKCYTTVQEIIFKRLVASEMTLKITKSLVKEVFHSPCYYFKPLCLAYTTAYNLGQSRKWFTAVNITMHIIFIVHMISNSSVKQILANNMCYFLTYGIYKGFQGFQYQKCLSTSLKVSK